MAPLARAVGVGTVPLARVIRAVGIVRGGRGAAGLAGLRRLTRLGLPLLGVARLRLPLAAPRLRLDAADQIGQLLDGVVLGLLRLLHHLLDLLQDLLLGLLVL